MEGSDFEQRIKAAALQSGLGATFVSVVSLNQLNVGEFDRAVVFYHGLWSAPSIRGFYILCKVLANFRGKIPLLVVNADELSDAGEDLHALGREIFGPVIGAWGETCWIKDRNVMARDILNWKNCEDAAFHTVTKQYNLRVEASSSDIEELVQKRLLQLDS